MRKCYIIAVLAFAIVGALAVAATAGAPNNPKPKCPPGYTQESGSTHNMVLCTRETVREVIREVVRNVPGPERIVEVFGDPTCAEGTTPQGTARNGAIVCIKEVPVQVRVNVPGPERVVFKTKIKRVVRFKYVLVKVPGKTHVKLVRYCPKKPNGDLAG